MTDLEIGIILGVMLGIIIGLLIALKDIKAADSKVRRLESGINKTLNKLPYLHGRNSHTYTLSNVQDMLRAALDPNRIKWPRA